MGVLLVGAWGFMLFIGRVCGVDGRLWGVVGGDGVTRKASSRFGYSKLTVETKRKELKLVHKIGKYNRQDLRRMSGEHQRNES